MKIHSRVLRSKARPETPEYAITERTVKYAEPNANPFPQKNR
jgi:hypothetical protein